MFINKKRSLKMKRVKLVLMLVVMLLACNQVNAKFGFVNPGMGFGFSAGGAMGVNSDEDKWVLQYCGYLQSKLISPLLLAQVSLGYTRLEAPGVYYANTAMADGRLLFIPFSTERMNPFLYGGFGVSKRFNESGSGFLPMIPFGIGVQTKIGPQMILEASTGYNLSLSDKLDGRERSDNDLGRLSNKKYDGFLGFQIGLVYSGGSNVNADPDKDGLTTKIEKEIGTNPRKADTDGDGLNDGAEVNQYKTKPLQADTDIDGLNDGVEVNQYKTDPRKMDSDNDGLNDGAEVQYQSDPGKTDTDNDGLNDGAEVNKYKTNPVKTDTDGDGLNDGAEANQYKTDPLKMDTDADGLNDGDEVNKYKTDPLKIDTDAGGANDGAEVNSKTNPLDSKDDIVKTTTTIILERGKKVVLRGVNFETAKATLTPDSKNILEMAYNALVANPNVNVEISGHTDEVGNDADNQKLSLERAQAVKNWLVQRGIRSDRMKTVGKGEKEPIADNKTEAGKTENRRMEFYVE
ncbi:MAG: hypothetical protein COT43_02950 [Candidatus Marinimicrobia bacterium CG08_land_8_20_14_0_20_45_22]|nr:MAG: hypothetical protein COT43_02950 [Candidatus Marinimicrobia bacterium CG08_land_8_20_14_0_20_45_22]